MTPLLRHQQIFLSSRDKAGRPTIWGEHLLTWAQLIPGIWFLIEMRGNA